MTLTAPRPIFDAPVNHQPPHRFSVHRTAFAGLLIVTGWTYLWNLSASGWANSFYSAAVQAGSQSWTAFLFGSSDAANAIMVDKTPAALWVMNSSVRLFGFNSWSVLAPQALEGVAAVALLHFAVRRINGPTAGLLAGAVLALTPVAALMFRFNNPDALLVLLLVAAAYCAQRACENQGSRWWLPQAGVALEFAFLAKMAQAFLVVPGFAWPTCSPRTRRCGHVWRGWWPRPSRCWCPEVGICWWSLCGLPTGARTSVGRSTTASWSSRWATTDLAV